MVEHRFVVVLARDHYNLVPDASIDDPLAVHLSSEAILVDAGENVAGPVHAPPPVAPANDCDQLVRLVVVVGCDELGQRLLWGSAAQEGDDVLPVASPLVLANRLAKSDVDGAFGTRRAHEHAVAGVAIALFGPLIRLALPLPHEPPAFCEIHALPTRGKRPVAGCSVDIDGLDDRTVEPRMRELGQKWAELPIRNALQGDREWTQLNSYEIDYVE